MMRDCNIFESGYWIFNLSDLIEQIRPVGLVLFSEFEWSLLLDFERKSFLDLTTFFWVCL